MRANIAARKDATPEAAEQRAALREAIALKNYEFNAHGVEHQPALPLERGRRPTAPRSRLRRATPSSTTRRPPGPGARLPHAWLDHAGRARRTLDLAARALLLLTGIGGDGWVDAAAQVAGATGVEIAAYVIGPRREYLTPTTTGPAPARSQEDGCVLVRPDGHVAWRSRSRVDDPRTALQGVFERLLGVDQP